MIQVHPLEYLSNKMAERLCELDFAMSTNSRNTLVTACYRTAVIVSLLSALTLPIASVNVSVRDFVASVLLSMEKPIAMEQAEALLRLAGIILPPDDVRSYNVLQAVQALFRDGNALAAGIVTLGSILLPVLKAVTRFLPSDHLKFYRFIRVFGARFAMLDVLVIAVLVVSVSTVQGWSVSVGPAAWCYLVFAFLISFPAKSAQSE